MRHYDAEHTKKSLLLSRFAALVLIDVNHPSFPLLEVEDGNVKPARCCANRSSAEANVLKWDSCRAEILVYEERSADPMLTPLLRSAVARARKVRCSEARVLRSRLKQTAFHLFEIGLRCPGFLQAKNARRLSQKIQH